MAVRYSNRARTTLAGAINASVTSISVASSASFPAITGLDHFYATIATSDNSQIEVVKVTAVSGTAWTVVRGQDGTTAQSWGSGTTVEGRLNASLLSDLVAVPASTTPPSAPKDNDFWFDSESGVLKIYYNDGTSAQWVDVASGVTGPPGPAGPAGSGTTINNTLTSTSTTEALSANMGKTLQDTKQKSITYGTAAPSGGVDGDIYLQYVA